MAGGCFDYFLFLSSRPLSPRDSFGLVIVRHINAPAHRRGVGHVDAVPAPAASLMQHILMWRQEGRQTPCRQELAGPRISRRTNYLPAQYITVAMATH